MSPSDPRFHRATRTPREGLTPREVWRALVEGGWMVLAIVALALGAALALTLGLPPRYAGEGTLRLGSGQIESASQLLGEAGPLSSLGLGLTDNEIETDVGVLESRQIAEAVVDALRLQVTTRAPRMPRDSILEVLAVSGSIPDAHVVLTARGDAYTVRVRKSDVLFQVPAAVRPGESFDLGGAVIRLHPDLPERGVERVRLRLLPRDRAVDAVRDDLKIERHRGGSKLVDLTYRSRDRLLAAEVVNAASAHFMEYKRHTSKGETRTTGGVLREQVASYREDLHEAEERLRVYREQNRLYEPQTQATEQIRRLVALQASRDGMDVERTALRVLLREIEASARAGGRSTAYRRLAAFPSFIANGAVHDILRTLMDLESQRSALETRFSPEHMHVRNIETRITELEDQLHGMALNYLSSLDAQTSSATAILDQSAAELSVIPAHEAQYVRLVREETLLSEIYGFLQTRLREAEIQDAIDTGDVRVVDPARVPRNPYSPNAPLNLVFGGFLGLMLAATVVIGRRVSSTRVMSRGEAEIASGLPVLSSLPARNGHRRLPAYILRLRGIRMEENGRAGTAGQLGTAPHAAFRALVPRLADDRGPSVLALLASHPEDRSEKTQAALDIAKALQAEGRSTLLVDVDPESGLAHAMGHDGTVGWIDLLREERSLEEVVHRISGDSGGEMDFLPVGSDHHALGRAVASERFATILAELRSRYGVIVLNGPPLERGSAGARVALLADTTVLVARSGHTPKTALNESADLLESLGAPVKGVLLSGTV
jgi:polysaccharide biosynthesis transport protein